MKGSTPTCFGVIMHLHSAHVPPVESRALRKLISQFAHLELSLAVTSSFQHGPMCSLSAIQEEVSLCCWTAGSLCSFCSWPQLLGRAKGGLQCLSPSQALPGPPTAGQPRFYQHSSEGCSQLDPCSALTLRNFSSNSPFNDHVQSQHSQPPLSLQPYTTALFLY